MAKLQKKGSIQAALKMDPKARQDSMIAALNLLAARDITEITFGVIPKEDD